MVYVDDRTHIVIVNDHGFDRGSDLREILSKNQQSEAILSPWNMCVFDFLQIPEK